jgi:hypothetical protein
MAVNSNTIDMGIHNANGRQFEVLHDEDPTKSSRGVEDKEVGVAKIRATGSRKEGIYSPA